MVGFLLNAVAVGIGAFGAHALKPLLVANGRLDTFETGVRYLFVHALAIVVLGALMQWNPRWKPLRWAAGMLLVGILFFSGSLLVLSLSNVGWWGAVAPVGGLCLIAGWLQAAFTAWKQMSAEG